MTETYTAVIPDEVAVRRRIDELKAELRLLRRQLRLSQECGDERDRRNRPAEEAKEVA